jgi:hypothetical protein
LHAERLLREARVAGGMSHPNIVVVYEVGLHDSGTSRWSTSTG